MLLEFIGRLPVVSAVHNLDDLMRILTGRGTFTKSQYQKFFSLDGVDLVFADEYTGGDRQEGSPSAAPVPVACARSSRSRCFGVMFDLPSRTDVRKCVITKETIDKGIDPTLLTEADKSLPEHDAESAWNRPS